MIEVSRKLPTYAFAALLLAIVAMLVVPLPPWLLDLLLATNVFGSALVLLLSVTVEEPLQFSAFAPALLLATLFRLALDVSATRLILTQGHEPGAVGSVIPAFGEFVVRGNLVVGLIVFVILITIQFVVIASGSQRVAEVAARFTLDAMPGKQMAIDADVHAGVLDAESARRKREMVQREADFYGAMDGAGKFVKGDAIAALVIVALNVVGGIVVGVAYRQMSPGEAIGTFALLSIGNALVTTLPAFLLSTAMGMMVTRVASDGALGSDLAAQLFARPDVLRCAGTLLLVLGLVPALPRPVFFVLGALAFVAAQAAARRTRAGERLRAAERERAKRHAMRRPEMALSLVGVDVVGIDFGSDLTPLLAPPASEALLDRVGEVRRALAAEIGVVLPGVRLRDDLSRQNDEYAIRIRDEIVARGRLDLMKLLAIADPAVLDAIPGEDVVEPVYGLSAKAIAPEARERAIRAGALVFDPVSVLGSHLAEVARAHAAALLGRQELQTMLEHLRATVPSVVRDVGTDVLPLPVVQKAFALLLRERVWPRDVVGVLEAMVDAGPSRDPRDLAEAARRVAVPPLLRAKGRATLDGLMLAPDADRAFQGTGGAPEPVLAASVRDGVARAAAHGTRPELVCTAGARPVLADFLLRSGVGADVYSFAELPPDIAFRPTGLLASPERDV